MNTLVVLSIMALALAVNPHANAEPRSAHDIYSITTMLAVEYPCKK
jgi:hypothetical protein